VAISWSTRPSASICPSLGLHCLCQDLFGGHSRPQWCLHANLPFSCVPSSHFFLTFFDSWKQHRSGEGGESRPRSMRRVAVGAKRRALTGLPRSVHSRQKNGRSPVPARPADCFPLRFLSARLPPQRRVLRHQGSAPRFVVFEPVASHTCLLLLDLVDDPVECLWRHRLALRQRTQQVH
jgi:hypothetical protein